MDTKFFAAMQRIMMVADPEDVRVIVENANAAIRAERERCAAIVRCYASADCETALLEAVADGEVPAAQHFRARALGVAAVEWGRCSTCGASPLPIGITDCGGHSGHGPRCICMRCRSGE